MIRKHIKTLLNENAMSVAPGTVKHTIYLIIDKKARVI